MSEFTSHSQDTEPRKITIPTQEEIFAPDLAEYYRLNSDEPSHDSQSRRNLSVSLDVRKTPAIYPVVHSIKKSKEELYADTSDEGEFPPTTLYKSDDI
jgi:hypothetical protein